jgi:hypothetical protein
MDRWEWTIAIGRDSRGAYASSGLDRELASTAPMKILTKKVDDRRPRGVYNETENGAGVGGSFEVVARGLRGY